MPTEPTALESPFGFEPLIIPPPLTIKQALEAGIAKVERSRAWSDAHGHSGIRTLIGETGGSYIEETLARDGSRVVEIGAGKLRAAGELAIRYPSSRVLAVEPFVQPPDLLGKPGNLEVFPKRIEDITADDIPDNGVDGVFSGGHTWNYIENKLAFIQQVWRMLKDGRRGFIEYMGGPIQPPLDQIIKQLHLESVLKLSRTTGTIFVIEVKKTPGVLLEFGRYRLETSLSGNFSGDVNSLYMFSD